MIGALWGLSEITGLCKPCHLNQATHVNRGEELRTQAVNEALFVQKEAPYLSEDLAPDRN